MAVEPIWGVGGLPHHQSGRLAPRMRGQRKARRATASLIIDHFVLLSMLACIGMFYMVMIANSYVWCLLDIARR